MNPMMAGAMAIAPMFDTLLNFFLSERAGARAERLGREAAGYASGQMPPTRTAAEYREAIGFPGVTTGGYRYAPEGSAGVLNLDQMLGTEGSVARALAGAYGGGVDFGRVLTDVQRDLDRGDVEPAAFAEQVGGYFPEAEMDAWLAKTREDVAETSRSREASNREAMLSAALGRGKGLQEMEGISDALDLSETQWRASESLGAEAAAEAERNKMRMARGEAQTAAATAAQNLRSQIAQTRGALTSQVGQAAANQMLAAASMLAEAVESDRSADWQSKVAKYGAIQDALSRQMEAMGLEQADTSRHLQQLLTEAGFIAGIPVPMLQANPMQQGVNNLLQWMATSGGAKSGGGASGSFVGTGAGFSKSCVGADAMVVRKDGLCPLGMVDEGDEVLGEDAHFHVVEAADFGLDVQEYREDLVTIAVGGGVAEISLTPEHAIQGKAASEWKVGDVLNVFGRPEYVTHIRMSPYRPVADLMLAGNVNYLANGFGIESAIGKMGLGNFRELQSRNTVFSTPPMSVVQRVGNLDHLKQRWMDFQNGVADEELTSITEPSDALSFEECREVAGEALSRMGRPDAKPVFLKEGHTSAVFTTENRDIVVNVARDLDSAAEDLKHSVRKLTTCSPQEGLVSSSGVFMVPLGNRLVPTASSEYVDGIEVTYDASRDVYGLVERMNRRGGGRITWLNGESRYNRLLSRRIRDRHESSPVPLTLTHGDLVANPETGEVWIVACDGIEMRKE